MTNRKEKLQKFEYLIPLVVSIPFAVLFLCIKPFEFLPLSILSIVMGIFSTLFRRMAHTAKEEDRKFFIGPDRAVIDGADIAILVFVILVIIALKNHDLIVFVLSLLGISTSMMFRSLTYSKYFRFLFFLALSFLFIITLIYLKS